MGRGPRETEQNRAREGLVEATRALAHAVAVTDVPGGELARATETLASVTRALEKRAGTRCVPLPVAETVGVRRVLLDRYNPVHLPLEVSFAQDGRSATAATVVNALYEGPTDSVHGGVCARLMDNMLGILVQSTGLLCVTGTLSVRYLARTPLERTLRLRSEIVEHSGRKVGVIGRIECEGVRTVEAEAVFIEVPHR
ncbi:PaaI family thioesterase [Streptomyces sp. NPDC096132]|uniref:PaaI family thioesterase n=1 Tax=Streptomyces sp. NPDC096132 TaxID=3366075 RepID=UPI0037FC19B4